MIHKHTILLNAGEQKILEKLIREKGYRKQDIFRYRLRDLYYKEYPPYNLPKTKRNIKQWSYGFMNEKFCTDVLGGRVEGNRCIIPQLNGEVEVPLNEVKYIKDYQ